MTDVVVVPSAPLLLPEYAGLVDPAPDVRSACRDATAWLLSRHRSVVVVADEVRADNAARGITGPVGFRVADTLLGSWCGETLHATPDRVPDLTDAGVVVVADGCARRGEKAPGHLDERCFDFDERVDAALRSGEPKRLVDLDDALGDELLAGIRPLQALGSALTGSFEAEVLYAGDPFGVQYWVARWSR